jgi:hypothetical protein
MRKILNRIIVEPISAKAPENLPGELNGFRVF